MPNIDRATFEHHFKQVNASWSYEGPGFSEEQKELIYRRLKGDITEEEFYTLVGELEK